TITGLAFNNRLFRPRRAHSGLLNISLWVRELSKASLNFKPRIAAAYADKMSALGHKRTFALRQPMSALPPIATAKADSRRRLMSALPPKADMCSALTDVR